ncbi:hypothetical protein GN958_ATG05401 [Phytophthora infestans]|uniref:Uncharacterized protein n=1 Tax=Phytophthora infestans TaxID=4787 RepID=A0A8S9UXK0_PHYIN|nr:hypothetical protein GN958_ATG05401 [Phytophthora infestans]
MEFSRTTSMHCRSAQELGSLQIEYELTLKQTGAASATAQELDNQVREMERMSRAVMRLWAGLRRE